MASENVHTFTDANFESEVLESDLPVLVDFWAEWCGPCRMIAPTIEELASEMAGKLKVGKVDVDQNSDTATKYGIQSIPTLLLIIDGEIKEQIVSAVPKAQIISRIEPHIGG
ncbi:MAG: thioredoxin [Candidatus Sumerlaeota bacterium]